MPTYVFLNNTTGEVEQHTMRMSEFDEFKLANPHLQRHYTPDSVPVLGDSVRLGITKPPSDFQKYVVGRIKESVPGNTIKSKFGIPGEH